MEAVKHAQPAKAEQRRGLIKDEDLERLEHHLWLQLDTILDFYLTICRVERHWGINLGSFFGQVAYVLFIHKMDAASRVK